MTDTTVRSKPDVLVALDLGDDLAAAEALIADLQRAIRRLVSPRGIARSEDLSKLLTPFRRPSRDNAWYDREHAPVVRDLRGRVLFGTEAAAILAGDEPHIHRYQGSSLLHAHPHSAPHGYFGHDEDLTPGAPPSPLVGSYEIPKD